jgi:hypothetical protein
MAEELPNHQEFLAELTALSRKFDIGIEGCGCCGSPSLFGIAAADKSGEYHTDSEFDYLTWRVDKRKGLAT